MRTARPPTRAARCRRRIGLACLVTGLLLAIVFAVSAKWWFGYCSGRWLLDVGDGSLYLSECKPSEWSTPLVGWQSGANISWVNNTERSWTWTWWVWGDIPNDGRSDAHVYSVWPVSPLLCVVGAALFFPGYRAARRTRRQQCPRCAYSLAGIAPGAPCPECGTVTRHPSAPAHGSPSPATPPPPPTPADP
jgi:hypothetical protein